MTCLTIKKAEIIFHNNVTLVRHETTEDIYWYIRHIDKKDQVILVQINDPELLDELTEAYKTASEAP
jgi:hypothetical protein